MAKFWLTFLSLLARVKKGGPPLTPISLKHRVEIYELERAQTSQNQYNLKSKPDSNNFQIPSCFLIAFQLMFLVADVYKPLIFITGNTGKIYVHYKLHTYIHMYNCTCLYI